MDWHRQRDDRSFELEDLALEPIDGPGVDVTIGEDIGFDLLEVGRDLLVDGDIVVDDLVQDCMQRRLGPSGQELLVLFQTLPDTGQGCGLTTSNGQQEVRADDDHELAGLDVRRRLDVAQRPQDEHHHTVGIVL